MKICRVVFKDGGVLLISKDDIQDAITEARIQRTLLAYRHDCEQCREVVEAKMEEA